jgi:hypothetical protein
VTGVSIKVEGLKKLRAELKAIDNALPRELNAAGRTAAELVAGTARGIAPVLTGRLAATIKSGAGAANAFVKAGGTLPYGPPIHWGWARHNIAPNPFLYHALDERREEVIATYAKSLEDLIDRNITPGTGG